MQMTQQSQAQKKIQALKHANTIEKVKYSQLNDERKPTSSKNIFKYIQSQMLDIICHLFLLFLSSFNHQNLKWLWIVLTVVTFGVFYLMTKSIIMFQTSPQFESIKAGKFTNFVLYCSISTFLYISFDRLMHFYLDDYVQSNLLTKKYVDPQIRKKRSVTMVKYFIGSSYYSLMIFLGYLVMKDQPAWPNWLGGEGQCVDMYIRVPYQPNPSVLDQVFICISFAKHFSRLILHIFVTIEGDYYSMILHHFLSIFLIFFAYSLNFWTIGIFIILIHDFSDLFNSVARILLDLVVEIKVLINPILVIFPIIWIISRNVVFPLCFIFPIYTAYNSGASNMSEMTYEVFRYPTYFAAAMLSCLEVFHLVISWSLISYYYVKIKGDSKEKSKSQ